MDIIAKRFRTMDVLQRKLTVSERPMLNLLNNTGLSVGVGEVVVLDDTTTHAVVYAESGGARAPLVTITGAEPGTRVKCAHKGYGRASIACDGPEIVPGDAIVASNTAGLGSRDNAATIRNLVGIALTEKADGDVADVQIIV
jgi:hypothetical protein